MTGKYHYYKSFFPNYSNDSMKELDDFLLEIDAEDFNYYDDNCITKDGMYMFEYESSNHERDSSCDKVVVYKKED